MSRSRVLFIVDVLIVLLAAGAVVLWMTGGFSSEPFGFRVSARPLAARSGRNLWADSYERDARNVLSLQGALARAITDQIRAVVTPEEQVRLASSRHIDPQAFELYLQGRFLTDRENFDELNKAIERFRGAIEIEPEFALAYAGMAQVYYQLSTVFLPPDEAMPKARAAVERALELDPNDGLVLGKLPVDRSS